MSESEEEKAERLKKEKAEEEKGKKMDEMG